MFVELARLCDVLVLRIVGSINLLYHLCFIG